MKNPIIIDTDPGVDDFLAILFAIYAKLNIQGIVTVYGNSTIENTTKNALTITQLLNSDIRVFQGASKPLIKNPIWAISHGKNGLGGFELSDLQLQKQKKNAISFYEEQLQNNDKTDIVCIGPITNIAILFNLRPDLIQKVGKLIILGGVIGEEGNESPLAEFNTYNDPDALKFVLDLNIEKVLIPANVCRKVMFKKEDFDSIADNKLTQDILKIVNVFIDYYQNDPEYGGFEGGVMYDLLTIGYLLKPQIYQTKNVYIDVETSDCKSNGLTFIDSSKKPYCMLCTDIEAVQLKALFFETINIKK